MYFPSKSLAFAIAFTATAIGVQGEQHVVLLVNKCGFGSPRLISGPTTLSFGGTYVVNGPLVGAIAYLQTGRCGFDGVGCTLVETTLRNPPGPGQGSATDISLIPPLKFSVKTRFYYFNGCNGQGTTCSNSYCPKAYRQPGDHFALVNCQANNVNLVITFC